MERACFMMQDVQSGEWIKKQYVAGYVSGWYMVKLEGQNPIS